MTGRPDARRHALDDVERAALDHAATRDALDAAVIAYRLDPTPATRAALDAAQRAHVDAFYRANAADYVERVTRCFLDYRPVVSIYGATPAGDDVRHGYAVWSTMPARHAGYAFRDPARPHVWRVARPRVYDPHLGWHRVAHDRSRWSPRTFATRRDAGMFLDALPADVRTFATGDRLALDGTARAVDADPYCDGCDAPSTDPDRPTTCATCGGRIIGGTP